ncbi:MAG: SpoIID/LytB domain-containing protein [Ignavibacteriae bacterium]|nr:SpoIID/LytB domain-containing protein [Ignavibacteriota bacterium]
MNEPFVNVAILSEETVEFELHGVFYSNELNREFSGKFKAHFESNQVHLSSENEKFSPTQELILAPSDSISESFLLKNVTIGLQFHWEQKQNQRFSGSLKILIENEKLTVVNIVSVEQYLISVISSEMSPTSSLELLKAHAVISRSWLLAQMEKRVNIQGQEYISEIIKEDEIIKWYDREDHILYDVCADDHCQRYQGITKLHAHNAEKAVVETTGSVLMYDDKICDARFSKSCGGITESFENVWEEIKHPYLQKIVDYKFEPDGYETDLTSEDAARTWISNSPKAFCNTTDEKILEQVLNNYDRKTKDFYRWKVEYTQDEIAKLLNEKSGYNFGKIIDLVPIERGYSGRIIKLKIIGTEKTLTVGKELEIRKILSTSHLYSSAFIVEKENIENEIPQKFILIGSGWGHGVGLCQIGAAVMGELGYRFDEILLHYFVGAGIKKIY